MWTKSTVISVTVAECPLRSYFETESFIFFRIREIICSPVAIPSFIGFLFISIESATDALYLTTSGLLALNLYYLYRPAHYTILSFPSYFYPYFFFIIIIFSMIIISSCNSSSFISSI